VCNIVNHLRGAAMPFCWLRRPHTGWQFMVSNGEWH